MEVSQEVAGHRVVGGVDTHKDLHVAAVVDDQDRVLGCQCFATTRQGYRQMLAWMRSFGTLQRIGVEATGTYGAGLLRYMQQAGIEVLEVTTPDKHDRRKRGKNDDLDAQNAAHAAFAGRRTLTPKSRDGMIKSLRVLKACRKTAVAARRIALQMIHNTIVCAPDDLRETLRKMTRMQLVRTLAAWRPDLADYRNVVSAYRITLKSLEAFDMIRVAGYLSFTDAAFQRAYEVVAARSNEVPPASTILRQLYDFSVIGFLKVGGSGGGSEWVWKYQNTEAEYDDRATYFGCTAV